MKLRRRIKWLLSKCPFFPGEFFVKCSYWLMTGKFLNLKDPATFNEKLNWLKFRANDFSYISFIKEEAKSNGIRVVKLDSDPLHLADKLDARLYAENCCGKDILVPMIWAGSNVGDIPWNRLPDNIVIKCTHGSHCHIVMKKRTTSSINQATKQLKKWMGKDWYWFGREPSYLEIKPRILIEPIIGNLKTPPVEYKIMCFHGDPRIMQVHQHVDGKHYIDFYNVSGSWLNWRKTGYESRYFGDPISDDPFNENSFRQLFTVAEKLAAPIRSPYVRIDLCYENDQVLFREVTFFDSAGFVDFEPEEVNYKLGNLIELPTD